MNRYPGASPFQDTSCDQALFFGRDDEITGLSQRLLGTRLLVLYGMSGLGKTSLLKAGVFARLLDQGLIPLYALVRHESPLDLLAEVIDTATARLGKEFVPGERTSFWEFFKTSLFWRGDTLLTPVLVLDQFEEVFTLKSADFRRELARELGSLVSGRMPEIARERRRAGVSRLTDSAPDVKVILSLREEYVGALQELAAEIPGLLHDRYRLPPLPRDGAARAIEEPAAKAAPTGVAEPFASPQFTYAGDALAKMLSFLEGQSGAIEPWQLQLLCQHVEQKVIREGAKKPGPIVVSTEMLGAESGMASVLREFYSRTIGELSASTRSGARMLCEEGLLTEDGHRLPLPEPQILKNYALDQKALDVLIEKRLLRREKRLGSVFYELSHDSLVTPILESRRWRLPKRVRQGLWIGGPALALVVVLLVVWIAQLRAARDETRRERDRAEELVGFLIGEEWLEKLRAVGRTEIVDDVQKRVEQYVREVPADSRNRPTYLRNSALAHRNRGELLSERGDLAGAHGQLREAESMFRRLAGMQPHDPAWRKELAVTLEKIADAESDRGDLAAALAASSEAVELLRAVIAEAPQDERAHLERARVYLRLALVLNDLNRSNEALKYYDYVIALGEDRIRSLAAETEWRYHLQGAYDGRGGILIERNDKEAAGKAYTQSLALAQELTRLDPLNARYRLRLAVAVNRIGNLRMQEGRGGVAGALKEYSALHATLSELAQRDPKNTSRARDLAITTGMLGEAEVGMGRRARGLDLLRKAANDMQSLSARDPSNLSWVLDVANRRFEVATALHMARDFESAVREYDTGLELTAKLTGTGAVVPRYHYLHYLYLASSANALAEKQDTNEARKRYDSARQTIMRLAGEYPAKGEYQRELANVELRIVRLPGEEGGTKSELARLHQALEAARKSVAISPYDANAHIEVSRIHYEIARRTKQDAPDAALAALERSLAAAKSPAALERRPHDAHNRADLAYSEIARIHAARDDHEQALRAYESALGHAGQALQNRPDDDVLRKNVGWANASLASTNATLAGRLKQSGNLNESLDRYEKAVAAMQRALDPRVGNPADPARWGNLSTYQQEAGNLHARRGDHGAALERFRAGIAAAEKAIDLDRESADYRLRLVNNLAGEYRLLGPESADSRSRRVEALDRALAELHRLDRQAKLNPDWVAFLRELEAAKARSPAAK